MLDTLFPPRQGDLGAGDWLAGKKKRKINETQESHFLHFSIAIKKSSTIKEDIYTHTSDLRTSLYDEYRKQQTKSGEADSVCNSRAVRTELWQLWIHAAGSRADR